MLTVFPFHNGEWVLLFPGSLSASRRELGEHLISGIKRCSKLSCSVGISRCTQGIDQLSTVYPLAAKALYQRFYSGLAGVFIDEETTLGGNKEVKYPKELESLLIESIRTLNRNRMSSLFDEMALYIEAQAIPKEIAERLLVEMVVVLYRHFEHLNLNSDWSFHGLLSKLHHLGTLSEMMSALKEEFGERLDQGSKPVNREDARSAIEKTKRYIESNYHKDLSIEEVSDLPILVSVIFVLYLNK